MTIECKFLHTEVDPALEKYALRRLEKITRLLINRDALTLRVALEDRSGPRKTIDRDRQVTLTLALPGGHTIRIEEKSDSFERAIDFAENRFVRQLKRWLSRHDPTKTQKHGVGARVRAALASLNPRRDNNG